MNKRLTALVLVVLALTLGISLTAHKGRTDAHGGHHDRATGTYHFHSGPLAGKSFANKAAALKALDEHKQAQAPQPNPGATASKQPAPPASEDAEARTVYVTRTGAKYHGPACSYLSRSKIPIKLKDAKSRGYTACSRCNGR